MTNKKEKVTKDTKKASKPKVTENKKTIQAIEKTQPKAKKTTNAAQPKSNIVTKIFKGIFIYPSFYVYSGIHSIASGIKRIFSVENQSKIDESLFDSEIDINKSLAEYETMLEDSKKSMENINDTPLNTIIPNTTTNDGGIDITDSSNTTYFNEEVAGKLSNRISDMSSKASAKKSNAAKIKAAKQLLSEMKDKDNNEHKMRDKKYAWRYEAMTADGRTVRGLFEAYSKTDVINFLADDNLIVYKVRLEKFAISLGGKAHRLKNKELLFILTQLSTYLKSGISLSESIGILIKQSKKSSQKKLFYNIKYDLMLGESLSGALLNQGKAFPMILINMVKSAELTGELPEVLDDMAEYFTEIEETRKQMISALTYPTMVLVFTICVIVFVMMYVVPKFVDIYDSMESGEIPAFTQVIINISTFLEKNILLILLIIVAVLSVIMYLYKKVKVCRKGMQYLIMKMPVIGNIIMYNEVAIFAKTFASLLKHNVFITDSMDILNKITNNEIYHDMILNTITNLTKGDKISTAFKDQWAFPIPAYEMIVTGERTGQLAEMMDKVSSYYQNLHRNMVTRIKSLIEPIVIILLTFGVGAVLLAVVIPMFNMYQVVQQMES